VCVWCVFMIDMNARRPNASGNACGAHANAYANTCSCLVLVEHIALVS